MDTKPKNTMEVFESWKLTGIGILVELDSLGIGLPKGTILQTQDGTLKWRINCRIIHAHAPTPIRFPNETEQVVSFSFKGADQFKAAVKKLTDKEANWIFQYRLTAIEHEQKPKPGSYLLIGWIQDGPSNER